MTFMEIENHDDFYSFDKDNQVKVWDPNGVGVVYDVALDDLKQLEAELQVVGSYYLTKCLVDDQYAHNALKLVLFSFITLSLSLPPSLPQG